jgi:hypothetical protein
MHTTTTFTGRVLATVLAAVLATGALVQPGVATASTHTVLDPEDTGGKLDLVSSSHGHHGPLLEHTLVMRDVWASKLLAPATATVVLKVGDRYRTINLDFRDGMLFAEICTTTRDGGTFSSCSKEVTLSRPDRSSVRITLPERLVARDVRAYKWQARTVLNQGEGGCTLLVCTDRLPDDGGWVRHRL